MSDPIWFPPFRFDRATGELWRGAERLPLRPKTAAVLHALIEAQGQTVTREQLRARVWPGRPGTEYAPKQCVRELRMQLDDDPAAARLIETAGHGYRFIGRLAPGPSAPFEAPPDAGGLAPDPAPAVAFERHCAGREAELAHLAACYDSARRGERPVVFVTGEPGIGKTTLVNAFLATLATGRDCLVGRGQCVRHMDAAEAYGPLLDLLARWSRMPAGLRLPGLLESHAPMWLLQLPGLVAAARLPRLQRRVQGASRERMLRELVDALEAVASERTVVLFLEDLHWSDAATLDWLAAWAERSEPARVLVIGTYRAAEARQGAIPAISQTLRDRQRCHTLPLAGLSEQAVRAYLAWRLADRGVPPELPQLLHRRTEGHPLFLSMLVQEWEMREPGDGAGSSPCEREPPRLAATVPAGVQQSIEHQLALLDEADQHALEAASVIGLEFAAAAVAAGLEAPVEQVEQRCEALARRHHVLLKQGQDEWPDGTVSTRYAFRHVLYRDAIYDRLAAGRRSGLHRRIGARLKAAHADRAGAVAFDLARHFEQGHDPVRATRYWRLAGATALSRQAPREAREHFLKGLALLERWPEGAERMREELDLQTGLSAALFTVEGYGAPAVARACRRSHQLSIELADNTMLTTALSGLWNYHVTRAELEHARALAHRMLVIAEQASDPALLLPAHNAVGQTHLLLGDVAGALSHIDAVLWRYDRRAHGHLAAQYGEDPGVMCRMHAALACWLLGDPGGAARHLDGGMTLAQALGQPLGIAQISWTALVIAQSGGAVQQVLEQSQALVGLCEREGVALLLPMGQVLHGWALARQGQAARGIALIDQVLDEWATTGVELLRPYHLGLLAQAHATSGRLGVGLGLLEEALACAHRTGERWYVDRLERMRHELRADAATMEATAGRRPPAGGLAG